MYTATFMTCLNANSIGTLWLLQFVVIPQNNQIASCLDALEMGISI